MGFNIGSFLGSIAPAIGGLFGGPVGAALGTAVGSAFGNPSPPGRATTPPPAPSVGVTSSVPINTTAAQFTATPVAFRGAPSPFVNGIRSPIQNAAVPAIVGRALTGAGIVGGVMSIFGGSSDNISEILRQARENVRGATKNKIITAAKACGIELAASTFGLSTSQVCQIIVAGRSRRRRGVSAADVRRTKRTIRFVNSLRKDLKKVAK